MRYGQETQIDRSNVSRLQSAWTFRTGELAVYAGTSALEKAAFEATPLMIGGTLYFSTPSGRVFALDAGTGQQKWIFDPRVNMHEGYSEISSRGVSYWPADRHAIKGYASPRIFLATIDGRLMALDAATGHLIPEFGDRGMIDLKRGLGNDISETSPPAIIGNLVVVGSSLGDNQRYNYPQGTVRAFDVLTGDLRWSWDPNPRDSADAAWKTWQGPKAHQTGGANAWSIISADGDRDLVFIPATNPSPDYYGGERLGQNLYGDCLVAVRASTGKMVWYFQVVHHDLWDYDIAAEPVLTVLHRKGKDIPVVIIGTKMGHVFVLNRVTGRPVFPVEERPVPASDIPGEQAWKTQPFPVKPEPLGLQRVTEAQAWGYTDSAREESRQRISLLRSEGIFTPSSERGTIMAPANFGGIHWGGMCVDPVQGLLITNINCAAAVIHMIPRDKVGDLEKKQVEILRAETGRQQGTPYVMKRDYLIKQVDGQIVPQTTPPWGTLVAIDLKDGEKKWEVPLGFMLDPRKYIGAEHWGSVNFGGSIVTAGGLVFIAASMDNHFRAFDSQTGQVLWDYELPAGGQATPMTYSWQGKQYVVIAAGGHGKLGTKQGDYLMAFALP
jgi:quinoprotein glucose dehydrogenase